LDKATTDSDPNVKNLIITTAVAAEGLNFWDRCVIVCAIPQHQITPEMLD
jgi:hypothetical protein